MSASTKLGQGNVFIGVCHSVNRVVCLSACWDTHPLGADTPQGQTPQDQTPPRADTPQSRHPPRADTLQDQTPPRSRPPGTRYPPAQTPPKEQTPHQDQTPPWTRHPPGSRHPPDQTPPPRSRPPWEADSGIRSTSGQYASYWNAFLFALAFTRFILGLKEKRRFGNDRKLQNLSTTCLHVYCLLNRKFKRLRRSLDRVWCDDVI